MKNDENDKTYPANENAGTIKNEKARRLLPSGLEILAGNFYCFTTFTVPAVAS